MATTRFAKWGIVLGLIAQTGCCHWCDRWCSRPQQTAPACTPCCPTTVGYTAPVPVAAVPNTVPVYQAQQTYSNPTGASQVLIRNPTNGCYCPQ